MREAAIEAHLRRQVRLRGGMCEKIMPTTRGMPDRLLVLPGGRLVLVEMKRPGGRVSAAQELWHSRAAQRGVEVVVIWDKDQVDQWISENLTQEVAL